MYLFAILQTVEAIHQISSDKTTQMHINSVYCLSFLTSQLLVLGLIPGLKKNQYFEYFDKMLYYYCDEVNIEFRISIQAATITIATHKIY